MWHSRKIIRLPSIDLFSLCVFLSQWSSWGICSPIDTLSVHNALDEDEVWTKQFSRVEYYHMTSIVQGWKPRKGCHTWDEFFAGFPSFSERFSSGTPVFPSPYNPSPPNSNTIRNARTPRTSPNCFAGNQQLFKCFCPRNERDLAINLVFSFP